MLESLRPDPTFHASPRLAMEAEREHIAYTALLSPDASRPDALAVVDVDPGSSTYGRVLHRLDMPNRGDEFHHFGWNSHYHTHRPDIFFARRNNSPAIGVSPTSGASRATGENGPRSDARFNKRTLTTWRDCAQRFWRRRWD